MSVLKSIVCQRNWFLLLILSVLIVTALVWVPSPSHLADTKVTKTPTTQGTNPGFVGQWSSLIPFKTVPLHISLLPNGKLLYWGRDKEEDPISHDVEDVRGRSNTYVVDSQNLLNNPTANTTTYVNSTTNLFCSGHSFLPDGRLLVTGGHDKNEIFPFSEGLGETDVNFFDYRNPTTPWTKHSVGLSLGRWYPYNVTMENGNVAIMGGTYWENRADPSATPVARHNRAPEKYTYVPGGQGTLAVYRQDSNPFGLVLPYPMVQLAPNGKVLLVGRSNRYFDGMDDEFNPPFGHFTDYPFPGQEQPGESLDLASSVLYDVTPTNGKIMVMGGSGSGSQTVNQAHINITAFPQSWHTNPVGSMNFKRKFHTATLLPDGKVMVAGGTQCPGSNNLICPPEFPNPDSGGAVVNPEIWNPANPGVWSIMAHNPTRTPRLYHSIAILLPDARVLVGAGGLPGAVGELTNPTPNQIRAYGHPDAEIFSPPYLFNLDGTPAQRPTITWLQDDTIGLGQSMLVKTPDHANIDSVVLVRLGSVTHGLNQDQRRVVLNFTNNNLSYPQTLNVTMPATGKVCPPGPYMMFLLKNGVPSVAKMVNIQVGPQTLEPPPPIPANSILKSAPAVAQNSDGRLQAFYRGGDDALYTIAQTAPGSSTWTSPISLGGIIIQDPVVVRGNTGLLEVLVVGSGNNVFYKRQTAPNAVTFTDFSPLPNANSVANLALHKNADGRLQVFYRRPNNLIFTMAQSAIGSNTWGIQVNLGGTTATDSPAVGMINQLLAVFYRGSDGLLHHAVQASPNQNSWANLGAVVENVEIASTPAVGNFGSTEQLIVFGRGAAGDLVYVILQPPAKAIWQPESLGGSLILSPGMGVNADNRVEIFVIGTDNKLYNTYEVKFGWPWLTQVDASFGTPLNTSPVAALGAGKRLSVFVRGADNSLYMATQNGVGESGSYSPLTRITP